MSRLLVIEDQKKLLQSLERGLSEEGYEVIPAMTGEEGYLQAKSLPVDFSHVGGLPVRLAFGRQIFAMGRGRSVVPHGHNNMATAFLILKGDFQGKHYDRLEDTETHMIIRPTIDRAFKAGEHSTVSDYKDNVHWFKATSESAYIFNIHVMDVDPTSKRRTGRVYIDPAGEKLSEGRIKARKIGTDEVLKLYG